MSSFRLVDDVASSDIDGGALCGYGCVVKEESSRMEWTLIGCSDGVWYCKD